MPRLVSLTVASSRSVSSRVQELTRLGYALYVAVQAGALIDRISVDQRDQKLTKKLQLLRLREQDLVGYLSGLEPTGNTGVLGLQRGELLVLILEVRRLLLR